MRRPGLPGRQAERRGDIGESGEEVEPDDEGQIVAGRLARGLAAEQHLAAGDDGEQAEGQGDAGDDVGRISRERVVDGISLG